MLVLTYLLTPSRVGIRSLKTVCKYLPARFFHNIIIIGIVVVGIGSRAVGRALSVCSGEGECEFIIFVIYTGI